MATVTQLEALIVGLNVKAKAEHRRGYAGTVKNADLHAAINTSLDLWQIAHLDLDMPPEIEPDVMVGTE